MFISFIELEEDLIKLFFRISSLFPEFLLHVPTLAVLSNDVAVINSLIGIYIPKKMFMVDGTNTF